MENSSKSSPDGRRGVAVTGVLLVIFLFAIDATVVSAALPTIVARLGGLELYSWVFSTYMLASALSTPLFGNLSDLYGRRRLMLAGIALFLLGSMLCGLARSMEQLIVFRALQGVGGGAIYALSFILIGVLFPPEKRARMQAVISGVWGVASILGPMTGAAITQYWSWRWIFFINLPVCAVAALFIGLGVSEAAAGPRRRLDLAGLAALLLGLMFLFLALEEGRKNSFVPDAALVLLSAAAAAALAWLYRLERRAAEPIVPLELFRLPLFRLSLALTWLSAMGMFGVIGFLPLYVQGGLGGDPASVGLALVPASLGWTAGSFIAGAAMDRVGYRGVCVMGVLLMALGYGLFVGFEDRSGLVAVLAIGMLIGVGMGIVTLICIVAVQNGVPQSRLGVATSTVMLARLFGGAFGIALMGSVLFSGMQARLAALAAGGAGLAGGLMQKLADPQNLLDPDTRASIPPALLGPLSEILRASIWGAFLAGFLVMLLALGVSFFMKNARPAPGPRGSSGAV